MPHDKKGQLLKVGDRVTLGGTISEITSEQPTYCNIIMIADERMAPGESEYGLSLSARMVEKVNPGVIDVPPTNPDGYMASGKREPADTPIILPSRFQPGDQCSVKGQNGTVVNVLFTKGKVFYGVSVDDNTPYRRVDSCDVDPPIDAAAQPA